MKVGRKATTSEVHTPKKGPAAATRRGTDTRGGDTRGTDTRGTDTRGADSPSRVRRNSESVARPVRGRGSAAARRPREARGLKQAPQTAPMPRPVERPTRAKSTTQAKARSKARKAKAPKAVRPPLRERLALRLAELDLRPQRLIARVPFVVVIISSLGIGLGITLWLSTDAAQRSYQLGSARSTNAALSQQKEALERDVLEAESAPALAESARNLGMIPSKDTAHLVQDAAGAWVVVGQPKPAEGVLPPPLNSALPDEKPPAPAGPAKPAAPTAAPAPMPGSTVEVPVRITPLTGPVAPALGGDHAPTGAMMPGPAGMTPPAVSLAPQEPIVAQTPLVPQMPQVPQTPLAPQVPPMPPVVQAPLSPLAPLVAGAQNLTGALADILPAPPVAVTPPADLVPAPGPTQ